MTQNTNQNNSNGVALQRETEGLVEFQAEMHSGPLPHPRVLAQYNEIIPGAAERIFHKFEVQTEHRIKIENRLVWVSSIKELGGMISAFLIVFTTIMGGIYCALQDKPLLGGALSFSGLALLAGAFLYRNQKSQQDDK